MGENAFVRVLRNGYDNGLRFFDTALTFSLITADIVAFSVALSLALGLIAGGLAAWRRVHTPPLVLWGRG